MLQTDADWLRQQKLWQARITAQERLWQAEERLDQVSAGFGINEADLKDFQKELPLEQHQHIQQAVAEHYAPLIELP